MQLFGNVIRFGVQVGPSRPFPELLETWLTLEELGFDIAYITDHFVSYSEATGAIPVFEGPTVLSALATNTTRMRCGTMVAGNTFRNPAILAKVAVTLDHVSGGRFELGMGSGHIQFEHEQYNIPYHTRGRRLRMLGEAAKIVRSLLTQELTSHQGRYYELDDAFCEPKPLQDPLPLLIGGIGEDLTMRVVAESADIWNNWTSPDLETYAGRLEALKKHCADVGRDPSNVRKSLHIKPLIGETENEVLERANLSERHRSQGTPEQVAENLLSFVRLGVSDFVFMLDSAPDRRSLELLATQVAPVVREEGSRVLASAVVG